MGICSKTTDCTKCCCPCPCPGNCDKIKMIIQEADVASSLALIKLAEIFTIFAEPNTCMNLDNSEMLFDEILEAIYVLIKSFKRLAEYYDAECFFCYDHAARILLDGLTAAKSAKIYWKSFILLLKCKKCECVECEAFHLTRQTILQVATVDIEVLSLSTLLRDQC